MSLTKKSNDDNAAAPPTPNRASPFRARIAGILNSALDKIRRLKIQNLRRVKILWRRFGERRVAPISNAELAPHLQLGRRGEALAAERLRREGYRLVAANFKLNVGRNLRGAIVQAEIDLIAYEGSTLCFVEVKTRASDWYAAPEANVDLRKQRQITRAARAYRRLLGINDAAYRYDVASVILPPASEDATSPPPRVELLRNFWTDDKFRKRRWHETGMD